MAELFDRYLKIVRLLESDEIGKKLLESLLEHSLSYIKVVCMNDFFIRSKKKALEQEEYREFLEDIDKKRTLAHNALISSLYALNRYCLNHYEESCPVGGIYSLPPDTIRDRVAVADWAFELISEIFKNRQR